MKILVFSGGLGNQIFGFAFFKYLRELLPATSIYGIYNSLWLKDHNGLEINKHFDVALPPTTLKVKIIVALFFLGKKAGMLRQLVSMDTRVFNPDAIVYSACKMSLKFIPKESGWIRFKSFVLSPENEFVLKRIKDSQSVFIHVRRGDYYSPKYIERLGGTCPVGYYKRAIELIQERVESAVFFVFSDDMRWVRNNLVVPDPVFIDWNIGVESFIDMYLMSHCKYAIIANSTFSFWGAMLGNKKDIVTYPDRWVNPPFSAPDIFPCNWIKF
jgi:hypothetical protein